MDQTVKSLLLSSGECGRINQPGTHGEASAVGAACAPEVAVRQVWNYVVVVSTAASLIFVSTLTRE